MTHNVEVFDRSWRRERALGLSYFSSPRTWALGLNYDSATLNMDVSDSQILGPGDTLTLTLTFEDSADGVNWAQVGSALTIDNPDGGYRLAAVAPFSAFLRVRLHVEGTGSTDAISAATYGLVQLMGAITYRQRPVSQRPFQTMAIEQSPGCACTD